MYHVQCSSNFQTGKCNPEKIIMPRKCERDATVDKKRVILEIVEHIESHADKQFDITILGKMMKDKLSGDNVLYLI